VYKIKATQCASCQHNTKLYMYQSARLPVHLPVGI